MPRATRSTRTELDYAILHRTGKRVIKDRGSNMESKELKTQAIHIYSDLEDFFDSYDIRELDEVDELQDYVAKIGDLKRNFRRIHSELKVALGEEFKTEYPEFDNTSNELSEKFKIANKKLTDLKKETKINEQAKTDKDMYELKLAEEYRQSQAKLENEKKIVDLIKCAENLHFEIKVRYDIFYKKCSVDVSALNNYEVLDLKKREDNLHTELRELIDKVSSFEKFVLPCGELASGLCEDVIKMRDSSTQILNTFLDSIADTLKSKDISEKKLKSSARLEIKLAKFKGYYSEKDIYTFRSEFRKLVEPQVQMELWADVLKRNYLEGAASNLVSKIEDIEDIWNKLIEVYGNTNLMLQNKLSSLEKFSNLEKMKDDEKIAYTLTNLLNVMADLTKLAEDYNLEGELYHGGGIHKILDMMGKQRERKFIKGIAQHQLNNKEKWVHLVKFLESERKEREAYILNDKVRKSMNLDTNQYDKDKKNRDKEKWNEHKSYMG